MNLLLAGGDAEAARAPWLLPCCWPLISLSHCLHAWEDGKQWAAHVVGVARLSAELRVPPAFLPIEPIAENLVSVVRDWTAGMESWMLQRCFEKVMKPSWRIKQRIVFCVVFLPGYPGTRKMVQGDAARPASVFWLTQTNMLPVQWSWALELDKAPQIVILEARPPQQKFEPLPPSRHRYIGHMYIWAQVRWAQIYLGTGTFGHWPKRSDITECHSILLAAGINKSLESPFQQTKSSCKWREGVRFGSFGVDFSVWVFVALRLDPQWRVWWLAEGSNCNDQHQYKLQQAHSLRQQCLYWLSTDFSAHAGLCVLG